MYIDVRIYLIVFLVPFLFQIGIVDPDCRLIGLHLYDGLFKVSLSCSAPTQASSMQVNFCVILLTANYEHYFLFVRFSPYNERSFLIEKCLYPESYLT